MSRIKILLLALAIFPLLIGCANISEPTEATREENIYYFKPHFTVGEQFLTTKIFSGEELTAENKRVRIYRYEKYETTIQALDTDLMPIAAERKYLKSFYEIQVGKKSKKAGGKYNGKTLVFMPGHRVSVDGVELSKEEAFSQRIIGFEYLFLPEKAKLTGITRFKIEGEKLKSLHQFMRSFNILPDASEVSLRIAREASDASDLIWNIDIRWQLRGLLVGKEPKGVKLTLVGKLKYSDKHAGIYYFELKTSDAAKHGGFELVINRQFINRAMR